MSQRNISRAGMVICGVLLLSLSAGNAFSTTIVIDNGQPGYVESGGAWTGPHVMADAVGDSYKWDGLNQNASATYTPGAVTGNYDLQVTWATHPSHAANAVYTVTHAGGVTAVPINQSQRAKQGAATGAPSGGIGGSGWFTLGNFNLNAASKVVVTRGAGFGLGVDALRVSDEGRIIDEHSANVTYTGGPWNGPHPVAGSPPETGGYLWSNANLSSTVTYNPELAGNRSVSVSWPVHQGHGLAKYTLDLDGNLGTTGDQTVVDINQGLAADQATFPGNTAWSGWFPIGGQHNLTSDSIVRLETNGGAVGFAADAILVGSAAIPEPSTLVLTALGLLGCWASPGAAAGKPHHHRESKRTFRPS